MPDTAPALPFTVEELERIRQFTPHLHAVESHEGLKTSARRITEEEVRVYHLGDAMADAWADSESSPARPELFDRAFSASIAYSEATIVLEQERITYFQYARVVAREAVLRAAQTPQSSGIVLA